MHSKMHSKTSRNKVGMPVPFLDVGLKNTYKIGYLERGQWMGCVLNLVRGYYPVLKEDMWKIMHLAWGDFHRFIVD